METEQSHREPDKPDRSSWSEEPAPSAPESVEDLLRAIRDEQQQHRAEVAELRKEVAAAKTPAPPAAPSVALTPEEALAARMEQIAAHDYYCPGCGRLVDYRQQCRGKLESPHPAVEVVSTDELKSGDPSQHTAPEYVVR